MNPRSSLRAQVISMIVISFVLITALVLTVMLIWSSSRLNSESDARLMTLAGYYATKLDTEFSKKVNAAGSIENYVLSTFDTDKLESDPDYLDTYLASMDPYLYNVALDYTSSYFYMNPFYDKKPRDIWYWDDDFDGIPTEMVHADYAFYLEEKDKEWFFIPMRTGHSFWTNPYESVMLGSHIQWISYTQPIFIDDFFLGVVGSDFYYNEFQAELENLSVYNSGYALLINEKGDLIYHPSYDSHVNITEIDNGMHGDLFDEIKNSKSGIKEYRGIDGKQKKLAFSTLSNGWVLAIVSDIKEINKPLFAQLRFSVFAIAFCLVIAILVMSKFLDIRMKMLESVTNQVVSIGNGNYDDVISDEILSDSSEVGQLGKAVNRMNKALKKARRENEAYKENLERLVYDRTLELENANTHLEVSLEELQKMQEELVDSKKKEALSKFIIELAHRINTPLGNISMAISNASYIKKGMDTDSDVTAERFNDFVITVENTCEIVSTGVEGIKKIIHSLQLLDISKKNIYKSTVIIEDLIQLSVSEYNIRHPHDRIVDYRIISDQSTEFLMSTPHFVETVNNLIEYARKYGKIKESRQIEFIITPNEAGVQVMFKNNSSLRYSEMGHKAFEPFALNSLKTGSTGLELLMVYNLVTVALKGSVKCVEGADDKPVIEMQFFAEED